MNLQIKSARLEEDLYENITDLVRLLGPNTAESCINQYFYEAKQEWLEVVQENLGKKND